MEYKGLKIPEPTTIISKAQAKYCLSSDCYGDCNCCLFDKDNINMFEEWYNKTRNITNWENNKEDDGWVDN